MATPYSKIYETFLNNVVDYDFLELESEDLEKDLHNKMINACVEFGICKNDLSLRDDINKQFEEDLTDYEIKIIATLMISEWLKPKILNIENIRQFMSTKDFNMTSQANHLKELRELREDIKIEANQLLSKYSYRTSWGDFK